MPRSWSCKSIVPVYVCPCLCGNTSLCNGAGFYSKSFQSGNTWYFHNFCLKINVPKISLCKLMLLNMCLLCQKNNLGFFLFIYKANFFFQEYWLHDRIEVDWIVWCYSSYCKDTNTPIPLIDRMEIHWIIWCYSSNIAKIQTFQCHITNNVFLFHTLLIYFTKLWFSTSLCKDVQSLLQSFAN